ncbi:hypothetical protein L6452_18512 [Arctium lappa]|uniref:Uncharacterized protein n=1 Tax=Arctium lappa TaxID=4217 RepID=A0ACB9C6A2_ARCLA|nr:hypothetical protein L6452_18512 [Arctium lappa]
MNRNCKGKAPLTNDAVGYGLVFGLLSGYEIGLDNGSGKHTDECDANDINPFPLDAIEVVDEGFDSMENR